jgi:hypothetical protein
LIIMDLPLIWDEIIRLPLTALVKPSLGQTNLN